jgi:organic hydroperoxide reductase OsmC/OhrA
MAQYRAIVEWQLSDGDFLAGRFSRAHTWVFDGGLRVPASPSPHVVPAPYSNAEAVDPEEAFVAAIASCHMLTYLYLAGRDGVEVLAYADDAVGVMTKNEQRRSWVSQVTLRPKIRYRPGGQPTPEQEARLHESAHEQCFIANSVKTEIIVKPGSEVQG